MEGVALPVEGDEREVLPEGLRGKNTKRFLLAMETAAELSPDGDIIEHGRKLFRVQTAVASTSQNPAHFFTGD